MKNLKRKINKIKNKNSWFKSSVNQVFGNLNFCLWVSFPIPFWMEDLNTPFIFALKQIKTTTV